MESKNTGLIKISNNQLVKAGDALAITNKLLAKSNEQRIIDFFVKYPEFFLDTVSLYYPLNENQIEKYKEKLIWNALSSNTNISWTLMLIDKYENRWNWQQLGMNKSVNWAEDYIIKQSHQFGFLTFLYYNENIKWSETLLELYGSNAHWGDLPWTDALIEKYKQQEKPSSKRYMWFGLSSNEKIKWTITLIEKYEKHWVWESLSQNERLPWSETLISKYEDKWDWLCLGRNKAIKWSEAIINRFENHSKFFAGLSGNTSLPWSKAFIKKYEDRWSYSHLLVNNAVEKSKFILEKGKQEHLTLADEDSWEFGLSGDKEHPWSESLIRKYEGKWDWRKLGENENIPWTKSLITKYKDKGTGLWHGLSVNKSLPWSKEFLKEFEKLWVWQFLFDNPSIPWTIDLIEDFQEKIMAGKKSYFLWENAFKPYVTDEIIEKVFEEVDK